MRVIGVILPTETIENTWNSSSLSLENLGRQNFLDWQVGELRRMHKDPIIIIGPDGDDILRASPKLGERKMVFSKERAVTLGKQIELGLQGAGTCAFFLPLHVPTPAPIVWQELERALAQLTFNSEAHILQPEIHGKPGFPLLITPNGKDWLEEHDDLNGDFFDLKGLVVQRVPVKSETTLQELRTASDFSEWKSLYIS